MGERNWEYAIMKALHCAYGSVILSELVPSFLEQNFNSCKCELVKIENVMVKKKCIYLVSLHNLFSYI